jgi:CTP:phosphocholine cytidylyltransferase-like protein
MVNVDICENVRYHMRGVSYYSSSSCKLIKLTVLGWAEYVLRMKENNKLNP